LAAWAPALAFYQQALAASPSPAEVLALRLAMGEARFHSGDFAGATDDYQAAIPLAQALNDLDSLEAIYIALNLSLLPQSRYAEAIALGQELRRSGPPELAACAEFIWATGLALKSTNPGEAEYHVRQAERLLAEQPPGASRLSQAQIKYQLAGIVGQQGRAAESAALYREALYLTQQAGQSLDLIRQIMLLNNLAYQLSLLDELEPASQYAQAGIRLAQERGSLTHLSYLLSTSGEIALARGDVNAAEQFFTDGLALARQVPIAERIAGHTANLGLVATRRGQFALARDRLREALVLADALGASHLAVRIRIWLAPLLPPDEAAPLLREARAVAVEAGYSGLLEDIQRLEHS
jgi:tetratricopeptide (TPR) repeat protein